MIKIARPEKSILTGKQIDKRDILCHKDFITYHVGEITKVAVVDGGPGDDIILDFFDDKGRVFTILQRPRIPLYMATCLLHIDENRDDVLSATSQKEFQEEKNKRGFTPTVLCSDPRIVWIAVVHIWLYPSIPKELKENKTTDEKDELVSQILTDLIPSYDEAVENLKKNKYPPFASCYADIRYASEKYRGIPTNSSKNLDYLKYCEKYGDLLIEPPKVDWDKYRK